MSSAKPTRPASGRKANQDIVNFLEKGQPRRETFAATDSGFSRAGGGVPSGRNDISKRAGGQPGSSKGANQWAAPGGASDFGDLGIPT